MNTKSEVTMMMGNLGYVGLLALVLGACGSDDDSKPSAGTGSGGTGGDTGSTSSAGDTNGSGGNGAGGTGGDSGGASSTDGSAATTTNGGGGDGTSQVASLLNVAADCWIHGDSFTKVDPDCRPLDDSLDVWSVRIDADGQCWVHYGTCELEGLSIDERCGEPERDDKPPRCGEGGAGGEADAEGS